MRTPFKYLLIAILIVSAGCTDSAGPALAQSEVPASLIVAGDESIQLEGVTFVLPVRRGDYREFNPRTGVSVSWDVSPLVITASRTPQVGGITLSVQVLAAIEPGTYRIRRSQSPAREQKEFTGELIVPLGDGWSRHYLADEGVLEIASVRPYLVGSMTLRASKVIRLPSSSSVGDVASSVPAGLTIKATIGGLR